jgi:enoyl-CoA hydratase
VTVQDDGVAIVGFKDPGAGAQGMRQLDELSRVFTDLSADERVRVAIVTGAHQRFFTGPDLEAVADSRRDPAATIENLFVARRTVQAIIAFERPLIAAVNGPAFGVGTQVAFLSDIVVAGRSAYFQDPHVKFGVVAGDGGAAVWPLVMGLGRAKRYMMTGRRLPAATAHEFGAVAELVDDGAEMEAALAIADEFLPLSDLAVRMTKSALNHWLRIGELTAFDYSFAAQMATSLTPESERILRDLVDRSGD